MKKDILQLVIYIPNITLHQNIKYGMVYRGQMIIQWLKSFQNKYILLLLQVNYKFKYVLIKNF